MDKTWMHSNRLSKEYENGVLEFVKFAVEHAKDPIRMIMVYIFWIIMVYNVFFVYKGFFVEIKAI